MDIFTYHSATGPVVPIVISSPHSGVEFPPDIKNEINDRVLNSLNDTDYFLDQLYASLVT